jgi:mono/diheme cytochrome c family protein
MLLRHTYTFHELLGRFQRAALNFIAPAEDLLASRFSLRAPVSLAASTEPTAAQHSPRLSVDYKSTWWKFSVLITTAGCLLLLSACSEKVTLHGNENAIASKTVTEGRDEVIFPYSPPSVPDGQVIYNRMQCAVCHSADGNPVSGKATVHLNNKEWARKEKPVDQFEFIYFGKPGVAHPTVRGKISWPEAWNLVFYVRSLGDPPLDDKAIADIDLVFKSNCAVCHGAKGNGDGPLSKNMEPVPANFQKYPRFYDRSDAVLFDHIANGIKWEGMPNFLGKEDKPKNVKFDQEYIWKLVQYVRHFQETTVPTIAKSVEENDSKQSTVK